MSTSWRAAPFVAALSRFDDQRALLWGDRSLTYAELDGLVDAVTDELGPTRRLVLLEADRSPATVVAYLAALRGGHPVVLTGADADARRLLEVYDPDVVLAGDTGSIRPSLVERRPGSRHELHSDLALLLSTSGSTGSPKLVRLSRQNLDANTASILEYLRLDERDTTQTTLPFHYCYGLSVLNTHLAAGAGIVLSSTSVVDPCFWRTAAEAGITNFAGVPHTFELLDRVGPEALGLPSLRFLTQAGGRLDPATVRRYAELGQRHGWELFVMYGQTEATARMAYLPPELAARHPETIGTAVPGGRFRIEAVDDHPAGDVGELVYEGPNVMLGYAATASDLAHGAEVDELRTGDLARWTAEGLVQIVGRRSRFVKLFGLRVDLDELQATLTAAGVAGRCAGDDRGLVLGLLDEADVARATGMVTARTALPAGSVVAVVLDELPRLANGKPDDAALLRARPATVAPGPDVATIYARSLDLPVPAVVDDATFVSLGGDSLSYVEASVQLEALLGSLPPDWHLRPVGELRSLGRSSPRRGATIETTLALRALAITAVVVSHATALPVRGGAHLLLAVTGYNAARFQVASVVRSGSVRSLWSSLGRIAVPTVLWIAATGILAGDLRLADVLLLDSLLDAPARTGAWRHWYLEVILLLLAAVGAALSWRPCRRLIRHHPLASAWAVVGVGLLLRYGLVPVPTGVYPRFQAQQGLWLFGIGWVLAASRTRAQRAAAVAVAAVAMVGYFDRSVPATVVLAGIALLAVVPGITVPRVLARLAGVVAGASLFIYLVHWDVLGVVGGGPIGVGAALTAGVVVSKAWGAVTAAGQRRRRASTGSRRQVSSGAPGS